MFSYRGFTQNAVDMLSQQVLEQSEHIHRLEQHSATMLVTLNEKVHAAMSCYPKLLSVVI